MNVRHDALLEVTVKSGNRILRHDTIYAYNLNAHLLLISTMFSANPYGGQWHNPETGAPIRRPKYTYKIVDPDTAILNDGEECDCLICKGGSLPPLTGGNDDRTSSQHP